jgi:exopolysaccharide biosynthesis polyprenyl glycosylphosphotransferase
MKRSDFVYHLLLIPLDFAMLCIAGFASYYLRLSDYVQSFRPAIFNLPVTSYLEILVIVAPLWVLIFGLFGLYKVRKRSAGEELLQIVSASAVAFMVLVLYIFLRHEWFESRFIVLLGWVFATVAVSIGRTVARLLKKYMASRMPFFTERALCIGNNFLARTLFDEIAAHPSLGYRIVSKMDVPDMKTIEVLVRNRAIDTIIFSMDDVRPEILDELTALCIDTNIAFRFIPGEFQSSAMRYDFETIRGVPLISPLKTSLAGWGKVAKRLLDIIGSLVGLVLLSPIFLVLAIMVVAGSKGPVFVRLMRVSGGKQFCLYKFRSMVHGAHSMKKDLMQFNERKDGPLFKMKNDPRITRVGALLRKTRLDELPQLWNVLKGDMSLVGPRPHEPEEIAQYKTHQKRLLSVKAGITGLAQISGSSDLPFEEEVKLDVFYIDHWSLLLDIKILLKTAMFIFFDESAC